LLNFLVSSGLEIHFPVLSMKLNNVFFFWPILLEMFHMVRYYILWQQLQSLLYTMPLGQWKEIIDDPLTNVLKNLQIARGLLTHIGQGCGSYSNPVSILPK
jgi:hypothetical protein